IFLRMLTYAYSIYALHHNTSTGRTDDHGHFIQYQRDIDLFYLERQSESIESFLEFIRSMTQITIIIRLFLNVFIVVISSVFLTLNGLSVQVFSYKKFGSRPKCMLINTKYFVRFYVFEQD
ncbi:hypothetical protein ALC57_08750, partial [Trachymyrmex cornetzi]